MPGEEEGEGDGGALMSVSFNVSRRRGTRAHTLLENFICTRTGTIFSVVVFLPLFVTYVIQADHCVVN